MRRGLHDVDVSVKVLGEAVGRCADERLAGAAVGENGVFLIARTRKHTLHHT